MPFSRRGFIGRLMGVTAAAGAAAVALPAVAQAVPLAPEPEVTPTPTPLPKPPPPKDAAIVVAGRGVIMMRDPDEGRWRILDQAPTRVGAYRPEEIQQVVDAQVGGAR